VVLHARPAIYALLPSLAAASRATSAGREATRPHVQDRPPDRQCGWKGCCPRALRGRSTPVDGMPHGFQRARSGVVRRRKGLTTPAGHRTGRHGITPRLAQTVGHDAPSGGGSGFGTESAIWGPLGDHTPCTRADDLHVSHSRARCLHPI
jgi:hypothetical protein